MKIQCVNIKKEKYFCTKVSVICHLVVSFNHLIVAGCIIALLMFNYLVLLLEKWNNSEGQEANSKRQK